MPRLGDALGDRLDAGGVDAGLLGGELDRVPGVGLLQELVRSSIRARLARRHGVAVRRSQSTQRRMKS